MIIPYLPYLLALLLFMMGVYAIVAKKNGLLILEYGANLFLVLVGYRGRVDSLLSMKGFGDAPILAPEMADRVAHFSTQAVDPVPQALIVTSIVIGLGVLMMTVALCIRLYEKYGTFDVSEIRRLRG